MPPIVDNQIYGAAYDLFDLYLPQPDRYIKAMGQIIEESKQDVSSIKGRIAALEEKLVVQTIVTNDRLSYG